MKQSRRCAPVNGHAGREGEGTGCCDVCQLGVNTEDETTSSPSVCAHEYTTNRPSGAEEDDGDALPSSAKRVGGVVRSTSLKLQHLDTCRGARCLDCVTDDATHLAVTDQVSHWLQ